MTQFLRLLSLHVLITAMAHAADPWTTYEGGSGPGAGKLIVLISGDEEYRSEEALPQLGKILSVRHGFTCRVVFAIDPRTGVIDPDVRTNIPGLEALVDADLMIIATRFRDLPDEQMRHVHAYVESGRPIIGLRTATHAFALETSQTYGRYTWNNEDDAYRQGFGRQILGETWIAHHGRHGQESTRGIIAPAARGHCIVRGIEPGSIWGPTDVYRVRLPLPDGCTPIVLGAVLDGMHPDASPVAGERNDPMMPVAWTRTPADGSSVLPRRVFTTTMGAATDLLAEGTRRMLVNAVYWALEMEQAIPAGGADVRPVEPFEPSVFGFGGARRGVRPADHAHPPATAERVTPTSLPLELRPDARLLVVGNTFAERLAQSGVFDAVAHAAHPRHRLVIRHVPWSADEVALRPREKGVPAMEDWILELQPDVVFMCFGMSESFSPDASASFADDLRRLVADVRRLRSAAGRAPDIVLISPIAHEDLGPPWPTGDERRARDATLERLTTTMRDVAAQQQVAFVNLFDISRELYRETGAPLTVNGIHPSERGTAFFVEAIGRQLGWVGETPPREARDACETLLALTCDKHAYFRLRYRPTNTEYVWGRRKEPYGVVNFPPEMTQLERMVAAREQAVWSLDLPAPETIIQHAKRPARRWATTPSARVFPADAWSPEAVEAKGTETSLGSLRIDDPDAFAESFTLPEDYVVECFASERDFPELANPLALTFDDRGRLWVLCTPTYPHPLPGTRPRCALLILEDTDADGRADRRTVFADELTIPTGFAIDVDTVYLGQAPDLLRLTDTDGDDRADRSDIVLSGFGMCDSHHQISAFEWDPTGGILMHEGVFTRSNVETPYGTLRTAGAGVWRFDPRTERVRVLAHCYFNNPWGHVFDDYGASILADASDGNNFSFTHMSLPFTYPNKPERAAPFLHRGRPTAGCELIASRHFPDDVQGSFLVNQSIGFHGTRWDRLTPGGSTWTTEKMPVDLLASSDTNFRPVAMEIGPDGALYIVDWCNPIVGHMQYSVRDPRRDHAHGRIWRIRHRTRPLVDPVAVHEASISELLELLRLPERNTRQLARRRLQREPWVRLLPALTAWNATLRPTDALYDRLLLEDLWIRHAHGRVDHDLIERVMLVDEPRARAGAVRVLRHMLQAAAIDVGNAADLLERAIDDDDMRVRLEAVVASGFLPAQTGVGIAAGADLRDMDEPMHAVFDEVLSFLGSKGHVVSDVLERVRLERMPPAELVARPLDDLTASVRLTRSDLGRAERLAALAHLAGDDPTARATHLLRALRAARHDDAVRAVGTLLLTAGAATLEAAVHDVRTLATSADHARRAVAQAALMTRGGPPTSDPGTLLDALALMPPGTPPAEALDDIKAATDSHVLPPNAAIAQALRHGDDRDALASWLMAMIDDVADVGLDPFTPAHERAMAALRHLPALGGEIDRRCRIEPAADDVLATGQTLFMDAALGCARCHGVRGQGIEGFPPLDRSPWVLGDPRRAAGIVIHGLYGRVRAPDGRVFDSTMAPLGDTLDDEQIAAILTFVRQSWGNFAPEVTALDVAAARTTQPPSGSLWETTALLGAHPLRLDRIAPVLVAATPDTRPEDARRSLVAYLPPLIVVLVIAAYVLIARRSAPA